MRFFLPLALFVATWAAAAQAQNAPVTISPQDAPQEQNPSVRSNPTEASPPFTPRPRRGLRQRFEEANVTRDGRLTPEQAQASWPMVARHFAEIDRGNHGYVTIDDIRAYRRERRRQNEMQGNDADTGPGAGPPATGMSIGGKPTAGTPATEQ